MIIREVNFTSNDRLKSTSKFLGYCGVTLEGAIGSIVIRDIRVINGRAGIFLSMPARRVRFRCRECDGANIVSARFCTHCGIQVEDPRESEEYLDVAYPINSKTRRNFEAMVMPVVLKCLEDQFSTRDMDEEERDIIERCQYE